MNWPGQLHQKATGQGVGTGLIPSAHPAHHGPRSFWPDLLLTDPGDRWPTQASQVSGGGSSLPSRFPPKLSSSHDAAATRTPSGPVCLCLVDSGMQTGAVNKNSLGPHFRVCLRPPNLHRLFLKDATYWYRFVVGRGFVKRPSSPVCRWSARSVCVPIGFIQHRTRTAAQSTQSSHTPFDCIQEFLTGTQEIRITAGGLFRSKSKGNTGRNDTILPTFRNLTINTPQLALSQTALWRSRHIERQLGRNVLKRSPEDFPRSIHALASRFAIRPG